MLLGSEGRTGVLVELVHVAKQFDGPGGRQRVLKDLSLEIDDGQAIAVVGPSGSGKSTLLNLIGALDRPTAGTVSLAGEDLAQLNDNELARLRNRAIGFVFQRHHLLPQCTLLENCLLPTIVDGPANSEVDERARSLLQRVGLAGKGDHRPGQLSGGECQRAAVVRALINRPKLLLADEPTGSLDGATAASLGQLLVDLNREEQVALVVVTHSPELAQRMSRVLRLHDGELEP